MFQFFKTPFSTKLQISTKFADLRKFQLAQIDLKNSPPLLTSKPLVTKKNAKSGLDNFLRSVFI